MTFPSCYLSKDRFHGPLFTGLSRGRRLCRSPRALLRDSWRTFVRGPMPDLAWVYFALHGPLALRQWGYRPSLGWFSNGFFIVFLLIIRSHFDMVHT